MSDNRIELIRGYFSMGLHQQEILHFLKELHGINISNRTLKRILSTNRLFRRKDYSSVATVSNFLRQQLNTSGQMHGYRWMHLKCLQNGLVVTQELVKDLLEILDPRGVEQRRRKRLRRRQYYNKGPNFTWHMDSYDKLKPYGICINGCIDGFSRHIIWLRASSTASDPRVVAGYYVSAIKTTGGCPITIRADMGTENVVTERLQNILRDLCSEIDYSRPSFIYGKSTGNQRIEAWWSILRKGKTQYWINLFEMLRDDGLFSGSFLDKSLIQYCFVDIIQDELDEMAFEWNIHKIQKSRNSIAPTGRPMIMYEMPSLYDTENYLLDVPATLFEFLDAECTFLKYPCDEDVFNLCNLLVSERGYTITKDPYDAVQLYLQLRRDMRSILYV